MRPITFSLFGFPVAVGASFLIPTLGFGSVSVGAGHPLWMAVTMGMMLFACILVHELGHAFALRAFGSDHCINVNVHALGGHVAFCGDCGTRMSHPWKLLVALAGPFAGFAFAAVAGLGAFVAGTEILFIVAAQLVLLNVLLSVVNLFPVLPLDGGHAMNATLRGVFGNGRAVDMLVTAISSCVATLLVAGACLYQDPFAILQFGLVFLINFARVFADN